MHPVIRRRVVGYDLFEGSPSTEDVLEDKVGNRFRVIRSCSSSFGIGRKSTASMVSVAIISRLGHEERVDMSFSEQRGNFRNNRWNVKIFRLSDLAFVTSSNEPADDFV